MVIIFSIIAVVALVSLYDYFSARNWQQVTSAVRNDVVFEKRNKAYGAYAIRKDYDKRMILIMLGMIGSAGAAYAAFAVVGSAPKVAVVTPPVEIQDTVVLILNRLPEIELPETEKEAVPETSQDMNKLTELTVVDTEVTEPVIAPDIDVLSGDHSDKGDGKPVFTPPVKTGGDGDGPGKVTEKEDDKPVIDVDEYAEFPGGKGKMTEFLNKNLRYPEIPAQLGIQGKCYLQFVVNKDGEISNIRITRGVEDCPECGKEAARVIGKMPKWRPGKVKGKAVDSYFNMPINFVLEKN